MGHKDFEEDLVAGEASESLLMEKVRASGMTPHKPEGRFKLYDFIVYETKLAYEVKRDWKSAHTGNVVVEVEMPLGVKSGLQVTKADFWVFDLPDEFLVIKPSRIRNMIIEHDLKSCVFVGNGDTTKKRAYLVRVDVIKAYSQKVIKK